MSYFLNQNQQQNIINLYNSGLGSYKIAKQVGYTQRTVLNTVHRFGQIRKLPRLTLEQQKEIENLYINNKISINEIVQKLNLSVGLISGFLQRNNLTRSNGESLIFRRRRLEKNLNFDLFKTSTKESAYLLGIIFGDGCLCKNSTPNNGRNCRITIVSGDVEMSELVKKCTGKVNVSSRFGDKGNKIYSNSFYSAEMYNDLEKLYGLCPKKSKIMLFPKIDKEYLAHFYRGLVDTDGCWFFVKDRLHFSYVTMSEEFIKDFVFNLKSSLNIPNKANYRKDSYNGAFRFSLAQKEAFLFRDWVYKDSDNLRLTRKYKKAYAGTFHFFSGLCILN
jgi:hypothetical protein